MRHGDKNIHREALRYTLSNGKYAARTDKRHRVHTVADMLSVKMGGSHKRKCQLRSRRG